MSEAPEVVVVGAASRDLVDDDARGWRLGGGVSYSALALARLGLPVRALIGVDGPAANADELDLLRDAGAEVQLVRLAARPGVRQPRDARWARPGVARGLRPDPGRGAARRMGGIGGLDVRAGRGGGARGVGRELPPRDALVAVGWQGLLRVLVAGGPVTRIEPAASPLIARADLVGVGTDDFARGTPLERLASFVGPGRHAARHRRRPGRHGDRDGARRVVTGPLPVDGDPDARASSTRPAPATRSSPQCSPPGSPRRSSAAARATARTSGSAPPPRRSCASARACSACRRSTRYSSASTRPRPRRRAPRRRLDRDARLARRRRRAARRRPRRSRSASSRGCGRPVMPGPLEEPPRRPGRGERAVGVAEAVLAQLRDLDPGDRPERATGRGRGLPRLRRLRPSTEPAQHARPFRGEPLVRPARARVPRRRPRRRPEAAAAAVRELAPPAATRRLPAEVRPARRCLPPGVLVGLLAEQRPRRRRPAERVPHRRGGRHRVVEALERLVVAPLAGVRPRQPGEVARAAPRAARPAPRTAARRARGAAPASARPSRCGSRPRRARRPGRRAGPRGRSTGSPSPRRRRSRLTPSSSPSTVRSRASSIRCLNTRRTNGSRSRCPAWVGAGRPASR